MGTIVFLTYDDIPLTSPGPGRISNPGPSEDGFQFSTNMVAAQVGYGSTWPIANALSGNQVLLNNYGGPVIITYTGGEFSLVDTYIAGWNTQVTGGTISGFLNGTFMGQVSWSALGPDAGGGHPVATWTDVVPGFGTVDMIIISSGAPFILDNTTMDPPAAVPEPATAALLVIGMLMAMWFGRRVA